MTTGGSRTAGYVVCAVLAVPLVLLGQAFAGYVGLLGVAVALAVTAAGALLTARARSAAD